MSSASRFGAGVLAWMALGAVVAQATIVEISGSAVTPVRDSYLVGRTSTDPFYTHKQTTEASNCATGVAGHPNCPLSGLMQSLNEQQNVLLASPVATSKPGYQQGALPSGYGWQKPGPTIPAGVTVNSHYLWLNAPPNAYPWHDIATFKFDGPVLGIVGKPEDMIATNGSLGFDAATGPPGSNMVSYTPTGATSCGTQPCFVNEDYPNNPNDPAHGVPISGDIVMRPAPAVITMDFTSFSGDYIRVVTAANIPLHAGDFDHDYDVDNDDFTLWRSLFGSTDVRADADGDGVVGAADYVVWRRNLGYAYTFPGAGSGSGFDFGANVPEPDSVAILTMGVVCRALVPRVRRS